MQRKSASLARRALHREFALHRFRNALRQRQTQTRAMNLRRRYRRTPVKGLENVGQIRRTLCQSPGRKR